MGNTEIIVSEAATALSIIIGWITLTCVVGLYCSIKYRKAGADSWFVAGRKFGLIILWLSLGANIYSAYTFLGLLSLSLKSYPTSRSGCNTHQLGQEYT